MLLTMKTMSTGTGRRVVDRLSVGFVCVGRSSCLGWCFQQLIGLRLAMLRAGSM